MRVRTFPSFLINPRMILLSRIGCLYLDIVQYSRQIAYFRRLNSHSRYIFFEGTNVIVAKVRHDSDVLTLTSINTFNKLIKLCKSTRESVSLCLENKNPSKRSSFPPDWQTKDDECEMMLHECHTRVVWMLYWCHSLCTMHVIWIFIAFRKCSRKIVPMFQKTNTVIILDTLIVLLSQYRGAFKNIYFA